MRPASLSEVWCFDTGDSDRGFGQITQAPRHGELTSATAWGRSSPRAPEHRLEICVRGPRHKPGIGRRGPSRGPRAHDDPRANHDREASVHGLGTERPPSRRNSSFERSASGDDGRGEIIAGWHPVREALLARSRAMGRLILDAGRHDSRAAEILTLARERGIPVFRVPAPALQRLVPKGIPHQGIVAEVASAAYAEPEALLAKIGPDTLFVVLDEVQDPRNLGAILRTAAAVAASGVFLPERRSAGLTAAAAKASAGGVDRVPVARVGNLVRLLETMGEAGIFRVGLDVAANDLYTAVPGDRPVAIVLGSEERGLRRLVRSACDQLVRIPIRGSMESLNVSVAGGIALYEVLRARTGAGGAGSGAKK